MALPIIGIVIGGLAGSLVGLASFAPGFGDVVSGFMNRQFRSRNPSPAELIRMRQMGVLDETHYRELFASTGFSDINAQRLFDSALDALNVGDLMRLYYRFKDEKDNALGITDAWFREMLQKAGIDGHWQRYVIEANRPVPTLQDEIVFAVRDVYEPDSVAQAGLLEGIPEDWIARVAKLGLRREDAEKFWAAHWQLPSLTQVYEMYHRFYPGSGHDVSFTDADMDIFFNLADIAPGYRDRLKQLSYNPLGRIDIRRMYAFGEYGSPENALPLLIRDYRQIGYSPENAQRLARFTINEYGEGRKKFTQSQIAKFYQNKIWGEDSTAQASAALRRLGYDSAQAELLLKWIDLQDIEASEQAEIESIKARYLAGEFEDQIALENALIKVPVSVEKARQLEKDFERERLKNQSKLSRSDIDKLYSNKLITEQQYRQYLLTLGYIPRDIDLIVKLLGKSRIAPLAKPAKEDIITWYSEDIISEKSFVRLMREIGYRDELIDYYAQAAGSPLDEDILRDMDIPKEIDDYEI